MKALTILIRFLEGYSIKYPGQSSAREPMIYPSPTTLIGALAAAEARTLGEPEVIHVDDRPCSYASRLLEKVRWAAPALMEAKATPYRALFKALSLPYLRPQNRTLAMAFAATTLGRISYDGEAILLYIVGDKWAWDLAKYGWGITALGNKESLVEVIDVSLSPLEAATLIHRIFFPIPSHCVLKRPSSWVETEYVPPSSKAFSSDISSELSTWLVPYRAGMYGGWGRLAPDIINAKKCITVLFNTPKGKMAAVIPREHIGEAGKQ